MKIKAVLLAVILTTMSIVFVSKVYSPSPITRLRAAYQPKPYKDVTFDPYYNFRPFARTVWKTKTKVALANAKAYTGANDLCLLAPIHFDSSDPQYTPGTETHVISVLPPGIRLRIGRLMQDQGASGGVEVEAILLDGPNAQKVAYIDHILLSGNNWWRGPAGLKSWEPDPEMLESADSSAPTNARAVP